MNVFLSLVCVASLLLAVNESGAGELRPVRVDMAIDGVAVDTTREKLSRELETSAQCLEDRKKHYFDCKYTTRAGLQLIVISQSVSGVTLDVDVSRGAIPFGLKRTDSVQSVLAKIRKLTSCRDFWRIVESDDFGGKA
jgi:hypothetical protein